MAPRSPSPVFTLTATPQRVLMRGLILALAALGFAASAAYAAGDVTVSIGGAGNVTSDPAGFNCTKTAHAVKTGTCKLHYANTQPGNEPRDVTLTANDTAGSGYQFDHWLGACTGSARNCTVTVSADKSATAVFEDVQAPAVSLTQPTGGFVRGAIPLSATASDNNEVAGVTFLAGQDELALITTAPYTYTYDTTTSSDGPKEIKAYATDPHNNYATSSHSVTIDNTPPAVTVASGPNGQALPQGSTQAWSFSASDGAGSGVQSVQCSVVKVGAPDSFQQCSGGSSSHSVSNLAAGSYRFAVRATDVVGNPASVPQARMFSITAPAGGGQQTPQSTLTTLTSARVGARLTTDLTAAAKALAKQKEHVLVSNGGYSFPLRPLAGGTYTVSFTGSATKARAASIAKATTIAKATKRTGAAGTVRIKLKLTKAGKKLLRRGRRVKGTLKGSFAVKGGAKAARSKSVTLKRR